MNSEHLSDRSQAAAFAQRTRCNLQFIENAARNAQSDVHQITQITLSLLGLVIFPWERRVLEAAMQHKTIAQMKAEGWPGWKITLDKGSQKTETLGCIIYHLRNAAAHGRLSFSSDSREPREVEVFVEDAKSADSPPYWRGQISADQLREFCCRLLDFIEDSVS